MRRGWKERLAYFFAGRYGTDFLYHVLFWTYIVLFFVALFIPNAVARLAVSSLAWFVFLFAVFRVFSRNIPKRQRENRFLLNKTKGIRSFFRLQKDKHRDRKTHVYRRCPHCRAVLRFPKKKGKHNATCPRCKGDFSVKV